MLTRLVNFLWTISLSKKSKTKEFAYLIAVVFLMVVFFLLFHSLYFVGLFGLNGSEKNLYELIFLIFWTIYVVFRLKSIAGADYYLNYYAKLWDEINQNKSTNFRAISVYEADSYNGNIAIRREYKASDLKQDIDKSIKRDQTDRVIEFSTAIIAMMIMQYIT